MRATKVSNIGRPREPLDSQTDAIGVDIILYNTRFGSSATSHREFRPNDSEIEAKLRTLDEQMPTSDGSLPDDDDPEGSERDLEMQLQPDTRIKSPGGCEFASESLSERRIQHIL
jgi:hypothetical protein